MRLFLLLFVGIIGTSNFCKGQQCYAVYGDGNVVIAAMEQKLFRSTDGAKTFTNILPAGEANVAVRCITKMNSTLIIGGINGDNRIFRSIDNGETWTIANTGMPNFFGFSSAVPSTVLTVGNKVFMGGTNFFRVSEDEGKTWKSMSIDGATGGIGFTDGKLWHSKSIGGPGLSFSSDFGVTWQSSPANPSTAGAAGVGFGQSKDSLVVLTGENGSSGIKLTTDGGKNWQAIPNTLQLGLSMINVNGVLYACDFNGFHKSINNGMSWKKECDSFKWHTYGGKLQNFRNEIWMASANGPVKYNIDNGTCEVVNLDATTNLLDGDFQTDNIAIYVNQNQSTIEINGVKNGVKYELIDVAGKPVYTNTITQERSVVNTSGLMNGIYIVRISTQDKFYNRRIVLNR